MRTSPSVNGRFNRFDSDVHSLAWFSYLSPIFAVQVRGATVSRASSKQTLSVVQASCPNPSAISGVWTPLPWSGSSSAMGFCICQTLVSKDVFIVQQERFEVPYPEYRVVYPIMIFLGMNFRIINI
jgi:hypothetical protein